jgi:uncharacterized membrane protein
MFSLKKILKTIFKLFFNGLIAILPLSLTIYILYILIKLIYDFFDFSIIFLPSSFKNIFLIKFITISFTIFLFILATIFIGFIIKTVIGKRILKIIESFVISIPVIKSIYIPFKQLLDMLFKNDKQKFKKIVLIEYPSKDKWAIGFLTGECTKRYSPDNNKKYYTVFLPTTPNPTSGYLLLLQEKDIIETDITMDEAVKLIISGGIIKK